MRAQEIVEVNKLLSMAEQHSFGLPSYLINLFLLGVISLICCSGEVHVAYNVPFHETSTSFLVSDIASHQRVRRDVSDDNATQMANETSTPHPPDTLTGATSLTNISSNGDNDTASNNAMTQGTQNGTGTTMSTTPVPRIIEDSKDYYVVKSNIRTFNKYWTELALATKHEKLSRSHRVAAVVPLRFKFPFYGHLVDNITIATGGFIYMSPFLHQWLTATQYIAPLMANFDLSVSSESNIYYLSLEDSFYVEWRNVVLQDQNDTGSFSFQAVLNATGEITFVYKDVPLPVKNISKLKHPVKVGVSDAYYNDTYIPRSRIRRRTIYEYHRVSVDTDTVTSKSVVILQPLPTCNILKDCTTCTQHQGVNFDCQWCNTIGRCSDGLDWYRQHWDHYGCRRTFINTSKSCSNLPPPTVPITNPISHQKPLPDDCDNGKCGKGSDTPVAVIVVVILLIAGLVAGIGGWVFYAYTHPTSRSGMWLMEHRPSQMKAKIQFWKSSTDSGAAKYKMESEA